MDGNDPETVMAYYCFINLGRFPHEYMNLSPEERALIAVFIQKDSEDRKRMGAGLNG